MTELSLNILDAAQNSIAANAALIEITVSESESDNLLCVTIRDNGRGMDEKLLKSVADPFVTTRTTRKVGLGIPFFKMAAELTGGKFEIKSRPGKGTVIKADFVLDHIDRPPLGNMRETLLALIKCNPDTDFVYNREINEKSFRFDTREVRAEIPGISLAEPEVLEFISEYLDNEKEILN
jgi:anti-sigma regulatory factor (Ser/Thr protein kinase)